MTHVPGRWNERRCIVSDARAVSQPALDRDPPCASRILRPGRPDLPAFETQPRLRVPPGAIRVGVFVFIAASLVGFGALFLITQDIRGSLEGFRRFDLRWALPCLVLACLDWTGGGLRLCLLAVPLKFDVAFKRCVPIAGATAALASLTPSGTGGGPAQLYGLVRGGASLGRALAANFASVTVNLMFLSLAGLGAWYFGAASGLEGIELPVGGISAAALFEWSALAFGVIASLILLFGLSPRWPRAVVLRLFGRTPRVRKALRFLQELHGSIIIYARRGKRYILLAVLADVIPFGARFAMGYAVLRGFGVEAPFWNVFMLHALLHFLLYFMPTPGGSGIAEILAPALMSPFLPSQLLVAYTAVWRFFLTYITVLAGGMVLFRWLQTDHRRLAVATTGVEGSGAGPPASR
ncbi:MAG: flippase-like domain-containing protein [Gemmatimonadota bacterium]|nr:flippase-like domain-containing protein [Gemmatimonadota bacterium]